MGLLDFLNSAEAQTGLGLLAAAGPRSDGAGFGQRMLEGLSQGDRWKAQQAAAKRAEMQDQMQQMQMAQAQAQLQQQQKLQGLAQQFARPEGFDYGGYANALAGVDPMRAMEIQKSIAKQGPEFSTAPQYDQQGRAFILAKDGSMKYLDGVKARDKLQEVRLGDKVGFRTDYSTDMQGSMPIAQSPDSVARTAATLRGQDLTNARANERLSFDKEGGAASVRPAKQGPMSVTLQKELLESDDVAQSSKAIIGTLQQAKKINNEAYSGYGAKARATLASNLPWQSNSADATINLDNMMTGQGLDQMKTIFGAAPTEGERKILMDMQASADKTPKQREAIMDRAIAAAQRRGEFANQKAKAIRGGTYLTDGITESAASPQPATGKTVVKTGMYGGRKVVQYDDGTTDYAN